jgi:hypothetical protein
MECFLLSVAGTIDEMLEGILDDPLPLDVSNTIFLPESPRKSVNKETQTENIKYKKNELSKHTREVWLAAINIVILNNKMKKLEQKKLEQKKLEQKKLEQKKLFEDWDFIPDLNV